MKLEQLIDGGEGLAHEKKFYLAIDYFKEARDNLFLNYAQGNLSEWEMAERCAYINGRILTMRAEMERLRTKRKPSKRRG